MNILLISPPWGDFYGGFSSLTRFLNLNTPLNLGYLASSLHSSGHRVLIRDLEMFPDRFSLLRPDIQTFKPDLAGITVPSPAFPLVVRLVRHIKELGLPVLLGGPHITIERSAIFQDCPEADYALCGESEHSIIRLVQAIELNRQTDIPGLVRPGDPVMDRYEPPTLIENLDELEPPIFPGVDIGKYIWSVKGRGHVPTRTIISSRGCPFQCVFCCIEKLTGRKVRFRTPTMVVEEIEQSVRSSPARHFVFVDDLLTLKKERILDLSDGISRLPIPITWEGDTRADYVDEPLLSAMARSGCVRMNFGIETGAPEIMEGLKKKLDLSRVVEAFRMAKGVGMETRGTAMIGNPGDTRQTIRRTIRFIKGIRDLDQPYLSIAQPYPGTELRNMALEGRSNLTVLEDHLGHMRRYGSAVMQVGDITPEEMIAIQRRALWTLYLTPKRLLYNLFRAGLVDGIHMAFGLARSTFLAALFHHKQSTERAKHK